MLKWIPAHRRQHGDMGIAVRDGAPCEEIPGRIERPVRQGTPGLRGLRRVTQDARGALP